MSFQEGLTPQVVTGETIRQTCVRLGIQWKRAKHWITSPDEGYTRKNRCDRLIALAQVHPDWALGFGDEVWWSRVAQPAAHAWQEPEQPVRLVEQTAPPDDPDPKALAWYGLLIRPPDQAEQVWRRFVQGR